MFNKLQRMKDCCFVITFYFLAFGRASQIGGKAKNETNKQGSDCGLGTHTGVGNKINVA